MCPFPLLRAQSRTAVQLLPKKLRLGEGERSRSLCDPNLILTHPILSSFMHVATFLSQYKLNYGLLWIEIQVFTQASTEIADSTPSKMRSHALRGSSTQPRSCKISQPKCLLSNLFRPTLYMYACTSFMQPLRCNLFVQESSCNLRARQP